MPRPKYNEEIFKDSTMTFGEHLQDLRICLFRAILGLLVGVVIGLFAGKWVVDLIQSPLERALKKYYKADTERRFEREVADAEAQDRPLLDDPEKIKELIDRGFAVEEWYLSPSQIVARLKDHFPQFKGLQVPAPNAAAAAAGEDLVRIPIWRPLSDDPRVRAKSFNPHEPFMIWLKASLLVGVVLACPWIFYQIWSFVAAGLYPHEKRYVHVYLPFSIGLFLFGVVVAFVWVFEPVLTFLFSFNRTLGIDPDPRISEWLGFVMILPLGFGIAFQLPLVMLFLERIGICTVRTYLKYWRVAILIIFVIAAVLTPPDPWSMSLLAFPLSLLYFGGILLCRLMPRRRGILPAMDD